MDYVAYNHQKTNSDTHILDTKSADVNGDGISDSVYLKGSKSQGAIVISNISVVIQDGKTKKEYQIKLKVNKGYNPKLFLGRFTNDKVSDILISIESGNTGREGYFYIYSFVNNKDLKLFDFEEFNNKYKYDVTYKNNYIVNVSSRLLNKQFIIDISSKGNNYLSQLYDKEGKLKKPLKGLMSPLIELSPIVSDKDVIYNLHAVQRVIGYYNADTLGMMVSPLQWNGSEFAVIDNNPYLTLAGANIKQNI